MAQTDVSIMTVGSSKVVNREPDGLATQAYVFIDCFFLFNFCFIIERKKDPDCITDTFFNTAFACIMSS